MRKYKILLLTLLLSAVSFAGYIGFAQAHSVKTGDSVVASKDEKIDNTLYTAGNNVNIDSEVVGDLFCAGQTVNINGTVHGDVICAGQTVNINGTVEGDIRVAGQNITVDGNVEGNATIAAQAFTLTSSGKIGGDVTLGSADGTFSGSVGRDITAGGGTLVIASQVGRDITGTFEDIKLTSGARVQGGIDYTSSNQLQKETGAVVAGKVTQTVPKQTTSNKRGAIFGFSVGWFLYWFIAMIVTALALTLLFPRLFHVVTDRGMPRPWKALLAGFVASFAVPILLVILAITAVGIPLALILGLMWAIVAMLSGPVFGYYIGRHLLRGSRRPILIMLSGASLLLVLYFIPVIGFIALLSAFWIGSGMLLLELFRRTPRPAYTLSDRPPAKKARQKK